MNAKHTKGPLAVLETPTAFVVKAADGLVVVRLSWQPMGLRIPHPTRDEALANARLIAAAPDMYEALSEFVREYDGFEDGDGNPCPTLARAIAALAKANGEDAS